MEGEIRCKSAKKSSRIDSLNNRERLLFSQWELTKLQDLMDSSRVSTSIIRGSWLRQMYYKQFLSISKLGKSLSLWQQPLSISFLNPIMHLQLQITGRYLVVMSFTKSYSRA